MMNSMIIISLLCSVVISTLLGLIIIQHGRLKYAQQQVKHLTKTSQRFCDLISHEMRTPMNGFMGHLSLLDKNSLADDQKQYIDKAKTSANMLISLLDDILVITTGEHDYRQFKTCTSFQPTEFCEQLLNEYEFDAEHNGIKLHLLVEASIPISIFAPERALRVAARHLLSNALQHSQGENVWLEISAKINDHLKTGTLSLRVRDDGIGLSQKTSASLFQLFETLREHDHEDDPNQSGIGIGLPLSKKVLAAAGGKIGFLSQEENGAAFWIRLPFKIEKIASTALGITYPAHEILLIDNFAERASILAEYLQLLTKTRNDLLYIRHGHLEAHEPNMQIIISDSCFAQLSNDQKLYIQRMGGAILCYGDVETDKKFEASLYPPYSVELTSKIKQRFNISDKDYAN